MKLSRKMIESGMLTAALALTSAAAVNANAADAVSVSRHTVSEVFCAGADSEKTKLKEQKKEESEWDALFLADVKKDSWLNVRAKATTDSKVVGKLQRGAGGTVKKKGKEWTKIVSGDVTGYVKNEYCRFGEDAKEFAEKVCAREAKATVDGLRVREGGSTDADILTLLDKGKALEIYDPKSEKAADGWVTVKYHGKKAYVSADYVEIGYQIGEAADMTEAAVSAQASASSDELKLLAAIIECEAGGEPYAGKLAVGAVVVNRVQSGSFPDSISGVVYQRGQFTPAGSGKLKRVLASGRIGKSCYQAAREALAGADNTGGAKYFHAGTRGKGTVIGTQIFY